MDELEQKLNSILGNPEMMSQLMTMAQSLGQSQKSPEPEPPKAPSLPALSLPAGMDMNMLQKIAGIASQADIDRNQQALLKALAPYLNHGRIEKLEKAMRAAKIAGLATTVLGSSFPLLQSGR